MEYCTARWFVGFSDIVTGFTAALRGF